MKIKIVKTGKWAQKNPAKPIFLLKKGDDASQYPASEVALMIQHGWAQEQKKRVQKKKRAEFSE